MSTKRYTTVKGKLLWAYANLAMAHAAITKGDTEYGRRNYGLRNHIWRNFTSGESKPRSLVDDEKEKLKQHPRCDYCGSETNLSADHMIPTSKGGPDVGENLVRACRSCNSSKNNRDLLEWYRAREEFPPVLILRRYLKLCLRLAEEAEVLDHLLEDFDPGSVPFTLDHIPLKFPPPSQMRLHGHEAPVESALQTPKK